LTQRYGIDMALQAVARLRPDLPDIQLTIHGRGEFLDDLQRLAEQLELEACVHFSTEYMPMEELPTLIASADLGLVPYRRDVFTDGILPTKLMEYTALGMPAVVARTSAIEACFDETMVQFFTPGDLEDLTHCIRELYHDRARLAALAENAAQFNQRYNWTLQSANYVRLVDQLCSNEHQVEKPSSQEAN
jgi:glycosyltransferase involved in cell wall biosynthesis